MNYWDRIAELKQDNIWKRVELVKRLLAVDLIRKRVLEIGVGLGSSSAAVHVAIGGNWDFHCTDLSQKNVDNVKKVFGFNALAADISAMPYETNSFDVIIALDVLEHVEDKWSAFAEINRLLKRPGKIILNIPLDESAHNAEQEFGFTDKDLFELLSVCGMFLQKYEVYYAQLPKSRRHYAWAVGSR